MSDKSPRTIEQLSEEIRREAEALDPEMVRKATERAWRRLSTEAGELPDVADAPGRVLRCRDLQDLLPAYLEGSLKRERALLLEDHTRECLPCRRALKAARSGRRAAVPDRSGGPEQRRIGWRWAVAALVVLGVGLSQLVVVRHFLSSQRGRHAVLRVMEGAVLNLAEDWAVAKEAGEEVAYGEELRTTKNAGAVVLLADGSRVEMRQRSTFSVTQGSQGTTVHLERGNIIVEAAKQRDGKLFVATEDCTVSVVGTVFSVSHGARGSRVSVIEGRVRVAQPGEDAVLRPGQQFTSRPNLAAVALEKEYSWSRDADRYLALLEEIRELDRELAAVPRPGLRTSSRLLDEVSAETTFYAAVPNLSGSLAERFELIEARLQESPVLQDWWRQRGGSASTLEAAAELVGWVSDLGDSLGEEIVVAAGLGEGESVEGPVLLAEVVDPTALRAHLAEHGKVLERSLSKEIPIRLVEEPQEASAGDEECLWVWLGQGLVVATPDLGALQRQAAAVAGGPGARAFAATAFHDRLRARYEEGVETLVGIDLGRMLRSRDVDAQERGLLSELGLLDLEHLLFEQRVSGTRNVAQAVLSFTADRRGLAAWLAEPAPIGALDFVSPEAAMVSAFVVEDTASLLEQVFAAVAGRDAEAAAQLERFEREHGLDLVEDFAKPLGGEVAVALDGPLAPEPSWKLVVEVYDPQRLQIGVERLAAELDRLVSGEGKGQVVLRQEEAGGRTYHVLSLVGDARSVEVHYTFANGYLVAAPNRILVDRALRYRDTGYNLAASSSFRDLLPEGVDTDFSAIFYNDLGDFMSGLAARLPGFQDQLTDEQRQTLDQLREGNGPMVAVAHAHSDQVVVAGSSGYSPLGLLGFQGLAHLGDLMERIELEPAEHR